MDRQLGYCSKAWQDKILLRSSGLEQSLETTQVPILPQLAQAKVFSSLDTNDGFYLRVPFGVSLAPEEFQCKLHERLDDLAGVVVLRDDVLRETERVKKKPSLT